MNDHMYVTPLHQKEGSRTSNNNQLIHPSPSSLINSLSGQKCPLQAMKTQRGVLKLRPPVVTSRLSSAGVKYLKSSQRSY